MPFRSVGCTGAQIDGAVLANGAVGGYGGGSGGGVLLQAGTLSGSGLIAANGASGQNYNGGGGGRVAVYYGSVSGLDLTNNVMALAGTNKNSNGSVGTVYLEQTGSPGTLLLADHGLAAALWTPIGQVAESPVTIGALVLSGSNVTGAPLIQAPLSIGNASILNGANLTHQPATTNQTFSLLLTLTNGLLIDANSRIDASGRGLLSGYTWSNTTTGASSVYSGGSYGGLGGAYSGVANAVYGDYRNPNELGSGGGAFDGPTQGAGGGLVRISAGNVQVDGKILANGQASGGSGGSGGGIWLSVGSLNGTGTISASGANGNSYCGGGGGRVAVLYGTANFNLTNNILANAGTANSAKGSVGTVYLQAAGQPGELYLTSHNTTAGAYTPLGQASDSVVQIDSLVLSGTNIWAVAVNGLPIRANNLTLLNGAVLSHLADTTTQTYALNLTVNGMLVVDPTSRIDVSSKGYVSGYTFGNTTIHGATGYAAGSYGGLGGNWIIAA